MSKTLNIEGKEIIVTNPDKILFPKSRITKLDLVKYYNRIAKLMLPHIEGRPLSLQRFPNGIDKPGFFQKDASDYFPDWIKCVKIRKKTGESNCYVVCNDAATLAYLATQAAIVLHNWMSREEDLERPDKIVFDLDPSRDNDFENVKKMALEIRKDLEKLGIKAYVMSTGSRGLHVTFPVKKKIDFEGMKQFLEPFRDKFVDKHSDIVTSEFMKDKRQGKIFFDIFRNSHSQTAVAPYSVRIKEGGTIAAPLSWKEVNTSLKPQKYNIKNIFKRKTDPWKDWGKNKADIGRAIRKLSA